MLHTMPRLTKVVKLPNLSTNKYFTSLSNITIPCITFQSHHQMVIISKTCAKLLPRMFEELKNFPQKLFKAKTAAYLFKVTITSLSRSSFLNATPLSNERFSERLIQASANFLQLCYVSIATLFVMIIERIHGTRLFDLIYPTRGKG